MVVCKYYMEGYCKYGPRCRFEHANVYSGYESSRSSNYSSSERPVGTSILRGADTNFREPVFDNSFNRSSQQQNNFQQKVSHGQKYNVQEVMTIIHRDISQAEKGGQWQLSSYTPGRELGNMPGLEDHSPEELRWECYKAVQNGSLPLWQAIVQQLYANVAKINNELKKKDTGHATIDRWLREKEESSSRQANMLPLSSPFGGGMAMSAMEGVSHMSAPASGSGSFSFVLPQQQPAGLQTFTPTTSAFLSTPSLNLQQYSSPNSSVLDSQVYSTVEELSEQELEAFKADRFVFGAVPTKPPPKAFCNL